VEFEEARLDLIDGYESETSIIIHSSNSRDTVFPDRSQILPLGARVTASPM
jgi:hypothetical protein